MANTLITPTTIARQAIVALLNNWVMAGLVHRDYDTEFREVGDTITIRKPATFTAIEFDGDLTGEFQNVVESSTMVTLDTLLVVPIKVTQKELSLSITDFYSQVTEPALQSIAQAVDAKLTGLYVDIPYVEDCEGTTAISDILNGRKIMSDNKVPFMNRRAVLSPLTTASVLAIDAFRDLDKTGSTQVLREASLGHIFGFDFYENQNIKTHAIGSSDVGGIIDNGNLSKGSTTIHIDNLATTDTIAKGTLLTIADNTGQYVVTANTVLASNEADFDIYPGLNADIANDDVSTFHAALTTSKENLLFHKNAFAMVTAPLAPPIGGAIGINHNYKGLSIQVVYGYEMATMKNVMTISMLCGFKTMTPELAVRLYDAS